MDAFKDEVALARRTLGDSRGRDLPVTYATKEEIALLKALLQKKLSEKTVTSGSYQIGKNSYFALGNEGAGLIFQFIDISRAKGWKTFPFPIAFPNDILCAFKQYYNYSGGGTLYFSDTNVDKLSKETIRTWCGDFEGSVLVIGY